MLGHAEGPWDLYILLQHDVDLAHLLRIECFETEQLLGASALLVVEVERSPLLGGRLVHRRDLQLFRSLTLLSLFHVW